MSIKENACRTLLVKLSAIGHACKMFAGAKSAINNGTAIGTRRIGLKSPPRLKAGIGCAGSLILKFKIKLTDEWQYAKTAFFVFI